MKDRAIAFHVAKSIDISGCRSEFGSKLVFGDRDELFYQESDGFISIFRYGTVSLFGFDETKVSTILRKLQHFGNGWKTSDLKEEVTIVLQQELLAPRVANDKVVLPIANTEAVRLTLLHLSQSVALDHFARLSEQILKETRKHTTHLELFGKLDIGGKKLKKHIGRVLNINNQISEHLYIFDSHEVVWEDETLDQLDKSLKHLFDLKERYRTIKEQGHIIKENLSLFKDIMEHRESSRLEWVIIILILVEVLDLFITRTIN
ncbi:MAG: RMD1 family protein [Allomuricauda sp.]